MLQGNMRDFVFKLEFEYEVGWEVELGESNVLAVKLISFIYSKVNHIKNSKGKSDSERTVKKLF